MDGLRSNERFHYSAMPRTKRASSRARLLLKMCPKRGAPVRYGDRIAEVLGEARGERVMIRSLHADGGRATQRGEVEKSQIARRSIVLA